MKQLLSAGILWADRNILLPTTLCFLLGVFTGHRQPPLFSESIGLFALLLLIVGALFLHTRQQRAALFLSLPLFFLVGQLHMLHQIKKTDSHISAILNSSRMVTLMGTLATMPEERSGRRNEITSRFILKVEEVLLHGQQKKWHPTHGKVQLSVSGRVIDLQPGMSLMIRTRAGPVSGFNTPGVFHYQRYLAAKDISVSGWVDGRRNILIVKDLYHRGILSKIQRQQYLPEQLRQQIALFLQEQLDPAVAGLYQALLIGSRTGVSPTMLEQFKSTGTMHLLAISGLHMGLLGLMAGNKKEKKKK
ncbi:MAG: ComEC family competence protein [Candidatus Electrothrix sp. AR3]|nr:ComEC family competence protein [Candidatus Electrothrix sp. AR3]